MKSIPSDKEPTNQIHSDKEPTNQMPSNQAAEDIAVSVLGGYLGAGKTTLLNYMLANADERIAVVVNDFGDINIDEALIESSDGETMALSNGCICCSLVDGFAVALETIRSLDPAPERLLIEASGVADPATVAAWGHSPGFVLDATVVVVDSETILTKSNDKYVGDTIQGQLRSADIIVANKADLVDDGQMTSTQGWLRDRYPEAALIQATNAQVDPMLLLGVVDQARTSAPAHIHADEIFTTWNWAQDETPVTRTTIESMMDELGDDVVRAKGIVWLEEDLDHQFVVQRVGQRWTLRRSATWPDGVSPGSQLVFIGLRT